MGVIVNQVCPLRGFASLYEKLIRTHYKKIQIPKYSQTLDQWQTIFYTQYYYLDFYGSLLNFPSFIASPCLFIDAHQNSITQNFFSQHKAELTYTPAIQAQETRNLKQDQKTVNKNYVFSEKKKVHIKCKQSKIKKIDFIDKRNIIPNNINHILAFIQRKSKSQKLIVKIINRQKKQQQPYNVKGFYSYETFIKNKLSVHVNTRALQIVISHLDYQTSVFSIQEQLFYNKVSRIAIFYYLRNIAPLVTMDSQRLKNTSKQDHFKVQRFLSSLLESLSQQAPDNQNISIQNL